jgi:hypothetical protein
MAASVDGVGPAQWRAAAGDSLGMERNRAERTRAATTTGRILHCPRAGRDGVSRVLSHSYNARDTHGPCSHLGVRACRCGLRFTVLTQGPLWRVEEGRNIDRRGYLRADDGWLH